MINEFKPAKRPEPAARDRGSLQRRLEPLPKTNLELPDLDTSDAEPAKPNSDFQTPQQVAEMTALSGTSTVAAAAQTAKPKAKTIKLFRRWEVSRKKFFIVLILAVVLLGGGGSAFALTHDSKPAPKKVVAAVKAKPAVKAPVVIVSQLTGMPITAAQHDLPVTGVMIENSSDARPQSGLKDAGVVFEAIAEAGITRFLALYQEAQPANVGPVRSARPYYVEWADTFDASYAHVGGSPDGLQRIKDLNVKDLDQFYNPDAYHRITTRYAPHNVYTSLAQLLDLEKSKGYDSSTFTGFVRKTELPYKAQAAAPTSSSTTSTTKTSTSTAKPASDSRTPASTIDIAISGAYYNVHYDYDAGANDYKRSEGGAPHMDFDSNTQLTPKVVVALVMPYSLMSDGYHSMYQTDGSGKMFAFQDGTIQTGTWSKTGPKAQFVFKDDSGKILALDPGQTWITVVGEASDVTYK